MSFAVNPKHILKKLKRSKMVNNMVKCKAQASILLKPALMALLKKKKKRKEKKELLEGL
jgi:hypothetical protein